MGRATPVVPRHLPPVSFPLPPAMSLAPLDAALLLEKTAEREYLVHTSSTYWNIAGPFGGWVFAAGAKAILLDAELIGEPVEAHARFLAGPKSGLIKITVTRQSQGRSVAFWRAELDATA